MIVLVRRTAPGVIDKVAVPITMRTAALLTRYAFYAVDGDVAEGAKLPATAICIDTAPEAQIGDDGMLRMLGTDGVTIVAGRALGGNGKDAVLPATKSGTATTGTAGALLGKATLDWSDLKLKAPPSDLRLFMIGRPCPWCCDADPTATGVTVSLREDKPQAVVGVSINLAASGGQPAAGVRFRWTVTA